MTNIPLSDFSEQREQSQACLSYAESRRNCRREKAGLLVLFFLRRKEATRTPDPYVPNVVRYQLRYFPKLVYGSGVTRNRTGDTRIFSPLLYQLSYDTRSFLRCPSKANAKISSFFHTANEKICFYLNFTLSSLKIIHYGNRTWKIQ